MRDIFRGRGESSKARHRTQAPALATSAAVLGGLVAGAAIGAMSGPRGVIVGAGLGSRVALMAGLVMDREDQRRTKRTRELDDIIGITGGNIGTGRISSPPLDAAEDVERERWLSEWLTPPPPVAR